MRGRWFPLVVCALATVAVFGAALLGGRSFFFRDVLHYYWPTREAANAAWRALSPPLWNPYVSGGLPLLADLHAAVLYPPNLLFLPLPFPTAYTWVLCLHHVAGGLGVFTLLRRLTGEGWAGAAAALAWMMSGYVVSLSHAGPLMAGAAYVPWVLVALTSSLPAPRRAVLVALLGAAQALTGDPQSVLFSALAAGAFALWTLPRASLAVLAGGLGLGGLLAAVQLVPARLLLAHTLRATPDAAFFREWTTHPLRLAELLLPLPFGGYLEQPQFWAWFTVEGPSNLPFALSVYLGASAAVLALLGLSRGRLTGFALTLVGAGLLLALGHHAGTGPLHEHVPVLRLFRYPEKYLLLTTLGFAVLVGLGTARALAAPPLPVRRLLGLGVVLAVGALVAAVGWLAPGLAGALGQGALRLALIEGPGEVVVVPLRESLLTATGLAALTLAAVVLARRKPGHAAPRALLLLLLACDLTLAAQRVVWTEDPELFSLRSPVVDALQAHAPAEGPSRYWRDPIELPKATPGGRDLVGLSRVRAWDMLTLKSNLGTAFGLEEASGYGAVDLTRTVYVWNALLAQPVRLGEVLNACRFLTTDWPTAISQAPGMRRLETWPELRLALYAAPRCLPRVRSVEHRVPAASFQEALRTLASPTFAPEREAVVEGRPEARFAPVELSGVEHAPGRVAATARVAAGGGYLVVANTYVPGWKARVDGEPAEVDVANGATLGVPLPEGTHRVELTFHEPGLLPGALLSLLGALVAAALWLAPGARRTPAAPQGAGSGTSSG
jgi:hypothetical protein